MNLYFEDSNGDRRIIASDIDYDGVFENIKAFLDAHDFECYYTRLHYADDGFTHIDVGSHTEFFLVDADLMEAINNTWEGDKE
jgi:hypothetical protein